MYNKVTIILTIFLTLFLVSCRSTTPMPIQVSQPGDPYMSCDSIVFEMEEMANKVKEKDGDHTGQVASNAALGVAGVFLIVPWFFIDTSDAHTVEAKAAKERFQKLQRMYKDKGCEKVNLDPELKK